MSKNGIEITNNKELERLFSKLDTSNSKTGKAIKRVIKGPFTEMRKKAKANLRQQGSIRSGNLDRGLSTGSSSNKRRSTFYAFFGGRTVRAKAMFRFKTHSRSNNKSKLRGSINAFHLVNSGTKMRKTKSGANRGAVGKSRTSYKGKNNAYKPGFADNAIRSVLPKIESQYIRGLNRIYTDVLNNNKT